MKLTAQELRRRAAWAARYARRTARDAVQRDVTNKVRERLGRHRPQLSVVVPMFNVEHYLEVCLESIARQNVSDIEVIVVDDGSTDGSLQIAERFCRKDPRFRIVRQPNGGLGNARNTGARLAKGEYLAFVDSDDAVTSHGYEVLINSLQGSGSDFASGTARRLTAFGTTQVVFLSRAFPSTRVSTHVTQDPALLWDRVAWNKVFRRRFWTKHKLAFPEGVLYEDQELMLRAHFLARHVDSIREHVYLWRIRHVGEMSITQNRTDLRGLEDRLAAVSAVSRFIDSRGFPETKRIFDEGVVRNDIRLFIDVLDRADSTYCERLFELANEYLDQVDPVAYEPLTALHRLRYHLLRRRDLPALLTVIDFGRNRPLEAPVTRRGDEFFAEYPFFGDPEMGVPDHVYRLDSELALQAGLDDLTWRDGVLELEGYAYVALVEQTSEEQSTIRLLVTSANGKGVAELPVERVWRPDVTRASKNPLFDYDWSGFRSRLDPALLRTDDGWIDELFYLQVEVTIDGVTRRGPFLRPPSSPGARGRAAMQPDGQRLRVGFDDGKGVNVELDDMATVVLSHSFSGDELVLEGRTGMTLHSGATLRLRRRPGVASMDFPLEHSELAAGDDGDESDSAGQYEWTAKVPLSALLRDVDYSDAIANVESQGDGIDWRVHVTPRGKIKSNRVMLTTDEAVYAVGDREIAVQRSRQGALSLFERSFRPVVHSAKFLGGATLVLEGAWNDVRPEPAQLVLSARGRTEEKTFPVEQSGTTFSVELPLDRVASGAGVLPLTRGAWEFAMRRGSGGTPAAVKLNHDLISRELPVEGATGYKTFELVTVGYDEPLLRVGTDLAPDEEGTRNRYRLRTIYYPNARTEPLRDVVVYSTFNGRQYSDSPRAIYEELVTRNTDLEHAWFVRDAQVILPEGVQYVAMWSREYFDLLARARFIVTNSHLPEWFERREGQFVLQTWHGTPLKKIGLDIERVHFANTRYKQQLVQETAQWTHLISPSHHSSSIQARTFAFDGVMLETGYPRNDLLHKPDREERAAAVRKELGLPSDRKVVLYAPTWRDDRFSSAGRYRLDLQLDLDEAARVLSGEYVLMIRRHPNIVDALPRSGDGFVWDVTSYRDIAELFLVSDVLITDYSSVMADFAQTGRPILFFTYDLDHYRDSLRGFYFDFEREVPGPLLTTSDEVIATLKGLEGIPAGYEERYRAFREKFTALHDGTASKQVVDAMIDHLHAGLDA